jgi:uncharacterized RmlC-like cupin family protein
MTQPTGGTLPGGGRAWPVYVIDGRGEMFFGPRLEARVESGPADYIYIPADVAYLRATREPAAVSTVRGSAAPAAGASSCSAIRKVDRR